MEWNAAVSLLLLAGLLVGLSGCLDDDPVIDAQLPEPTPTSVPYGTAERVDGPVTTSQEDNRWRAERAVVVTNGVGRTVGLDAVLNTFNGDVVVSGWSNGTYQLTAVLWAAGNTESAARQSLSELELVHADAKAGDRISIAVDLDVDEGLLEILPFSTTGPGNRGAALRLMVPEEAVHDIEVTTSNGPVSVAGAHGSALRAWTSNGAVAVLGPWNNLELHTSNGAVVVRSEPLGPGEGAYHVTTRNGPIEMQVNDGPSFGLDVAADTTNGPITIHLADTYDVDDSHGKHVRTMDFDDRGARTVVTLETTNGPITVTGRG